MPRLYPPKKKKRHGNNHLIRQETPVATDTSAVAEHRQQDMARPKTDKRSQSGAGRRTAASSRTTVPIWYGRKTATPIRSRNTNLRRRPRHRPTGYRKRTLQRNAMAKIKWDKLGRQSLFEILRYGSQVWGKKAAKNLRLKIKDAERLLSANPLMGKNEPELQGSKLQFRSLVIHEHYKLIYYYAPEKDLLRIVDIWDTRMSPANLVKRMS